MSASEVQVLHVEDDRIQQGLTALHLLEMKELQFNIQHVTSEEEALDAWIRGAFDLVLVDYQLAKGNGLSCVRRIRQFDSVVPIIALSATASSEIACELIEAGADDFLSKQGLTGPLLCQCVRNVLTRARAFRSRFYAIQPIERTHISGR